MEKSGFEAGEDEARRLDGEEKEWSLAWAGSGTAYIRESRYGLRGPGKATRDNTANKGRCSRMCVRPAWTCSAAGWYRDGVISTIPHVCRGERQYMHLTRHINPVTATIIVAA